MTIRQAIKRAPIAFEPDRGREAAETLDDTDPSVAELITGMAGSSAYLASLIAKEHAWLAQHLDTEPEAAFTAILNVDTTDLSNSLRVAKRRAALLTALADLGGIWSLAEVTNHLSRFAEYATATALSHHLAGEFARGKLPMCDPSDLAVDCGMTVIGMGKLGARELNYSSDIDLIALFDETRYDPADYGAVRQVFVKVTQKLVKTLSEPTGEGYVFRTDLRLRPDPSVTPVCIAFEPALHYYESLGRTWERAAMIKARPIAGDLEAGRAFLKQLQPFIWRKHLDFPAVRDAQDMLLKIRDHKGLKGPMEFVGHDMKLGRGGIREIEFFAQSQQLIFGGRDASLRAPGTVDALTALAASGRIEPATAQKLSDAYTAHRSFEHQIQMLNDAQTHLVPKDPQTIAQLANLGGLETSETLQSQTLERLELVHRLTEIEGIGDETEELLPEAKSISSLFEESEQRWLSMSALRNARAREIFDRLKPALQNRFATVTHPEKALLRFEQFLSGLPSGVQVFSLFEGKPILLDLIVDICAVSPSLSEYLGKHKSVLDAVLDQDFFELLPDRDTLKAQLERRLKTATDYEDQLNAVRLWQKEVHFRNGVHLLRSLLTPREAAGGYSRIADVSVAGLLPCVAGHLNARHGPPPGRGAVILAMGKLGSEEMTAASDLDLIVIYDGAGETESTGRKPLTTGVYYARYTKALIGALTVPTSEGSLYEVDMRLRPSGRNGPVATSLRAFADYQKNDAWTWEHLALTRARVIAGPKDLQKDVEAAIANALARERDPAKTRSDVAEMREKLADAHPTKSIKDWETKHGPGRLLDTELFVQYGALLTSSYDVLSPTELIPKLAEAGHLNDSEANILKESHQLLSNIQQIARLVGQDFEPREGGERLKDIICTPNGAETVDEVLDKMAELTSQAAAIIEKKLSEAGAPVA